MPRMTRRLSAGGRPPLGVLSGSGILEANQSTCSSVSFIMMTDIITRGFMFWDRFYTLTAVGNMATGFNVMTKICNAVEFKTAFRLKAYVIYREIYANDRIQMGVVGPLLIDNTGFLTSNGTGALHLVGFNDLVQLQLTQDLVRAKGQAEKIAVSQLQAVYNVPVQR